VKALAMMGMVLASPAAADVVSASSNGMEVREVVVVQATPSEAYAAFGRVGSWWSSEHSYSGNAANLKITLTPGGCFCETLPKGGGVQHMQVVYVEPSERLVLTGSLGPLLYLATTGVLDATFTPEGTDTRIVIDYRAAGFFNGGADKIAPAVDKVLSEQAARLQAFIATRR